jgi:hypothetical protein
VSKNTIYAGGSSSWAKHIKKKYTITHRPSPKSDGRRYEISTIAQSLNAAEERDRKTGKE